MYIFQEYHLIYIFDSSRKQLSYVSRNRNKENCIVNTKIKAPKKKKLAGFSQELEKFRMNF